MHKQKQHPMLTAFACSTVAILAIGSQVSYNKAKMVYGPVEIIEVAQRGGEHQAPAIYTQAELQMIYQRFQEVADRAFAERQRGVIRLFQSAPSFRLETVFEVSAQGVLVMRVALPESSSGQRWQRVFDDPESFAEQLEAFARAIAGEIPIR